MGQVSVIDLVNTYMNIESSGGESDRTISSYRTPQPLEVNPSKSHRVCN